MTCQHIFPRLLVKKFKFTLGIMYENMVYIKINHTNKYRNLIWLKVMKGSLEKNTLNRYTDILNVFSSI